MSSDRPPVAGTLAGTLADTLADALADTPAGTLDDTRDENRRRVLARALEVLATRWPRFFAPSRGAELLAVWMQATAGCAAATLVPAATKLAAEHEGPAPSPRAFAAVARELGRKHLGHEASAPAPPPELPELPHDLRRIASMSEWAYQQLGSWPQVTSVWALLWETAPDDDARAAVRYGTVDRLVFRDAVQAVQRGRRASSAPTLGVALGARAAAEVPA